MSKASSNELNQNFNEQITDQFYKNNSFKTFKSSEYESKINDLSNQVKILRDKLVSLELNQQNDGQQTHPSYKSLQQKATEMERKMHVLIEENSSIKQENQHLRDHIKQLEWNLAKTRATLQNHSENQIKGKNDLQLKSVKSLNDIQIIDQNKQSRASQVDLRNKHSIVSSKTNKTSATTNLMRELLIECNQPSEFGNAFKKPELKKQIRQKDQFYEYKNTEDCFEPYYSNLSRELKIRLKKSLIKEKEVLYSDNCIEVGCICPFKTNPDDHFNISLLLVITNISIFPLTQLTFEYLFQKDIALTKGDSYLKNSHLRNSTHYSTCFQKLAKNEQVKEELQILVKNIDFQCIKLSINYQVQKESVNNIFLILPVSKFKLFKNLPYSARGNQTEAIEKVVELDRKVIEFEKLKGIFQHLYEGKDKHGNIFYSIKGMFAKKVMFLELGQIEEKVRICVHHFGDKALAEKMADEMQFLFQK